MILFKSEFEKNYSTKMTFREISFTILNVSLLLFFFIFLGKNKNISMCSPLRLTNVNMKIIENTVIFIYINMVFKINRQKSKEILFFRHNEY